MTEQPETTETEAPWLIRFNGTPEALAKWRTLVQQYVGKECSAVKTVPMTAPNRDPIPFNACTVHRTLAGLQSFPPPTPCGSPRAAPVRPRPSSPGGGRT